MYSEKKHIIEKVFLEVHTPTEREAYWIKDNAGLFLQEKLFPVFEQLFDEYDSGENIIRFNRMNVDFSVQDWEDEETLKFKMIEKVKEQLDFDANSDLQDSETKENPDLIKGKKYIVEQHKNIVEQQRNLQDTFLFFIENGYLPWYGKQDYLVEITSEEERKNSFSDTNFLARLKETLLNNKTAVKRLVLQFSAEIILDLIVAFQVLKVNNKSQLTSFIKRSENNFKNHFLICLIVISVQPAGKKKLWSRIVNILFIEKKDDQNNKHVIVEEIRNLITEIKRFFDSKPITKYLPDTDKEIMNFTNELFGVTLEKGPNDSANESQDIKPTILNKTKFVSDEKEQPFFAEGNQTILVKNAGLVLLGPFLPTFLKQFDCIDENERIKKEEKIKAVQAIHFLASGKTSFFENNLIFEKYLCGLPLATPIPMKNLLNDEVPEEAENLLRQVIKNWPALKNTGPDGLRQMFLERNGKLIQTEQGFKLIIERKVQDILLDKLTWNISVLKLPWKDDLLFIEW